MVRNQNSMKKNVVADFKSKAGTSVNNVSSSGLSQMGMPFGMDAMMPPMPYGAMVPPMQQMMYPMYHHPAHAQMMPQHPHHPILQQMMPGQMPMMPSGLCSMVSAMPQSSQSAMHVQQAVSISPDKVEKDKANKSDPGHGDGDADVQLPKDTVDNAGSPEIPGCESPGVRDVSDLEVMSNASGFGIPKKRLSLESDGPNPGSDVTDDGVEALKRKLLMVQAQSQEQQREIIALKVELHRSELLRNQHPQPDLGVDSDNSGHVQIRPPAQSVVTVAQGMGRREELAENALKARITQGLERELSLNKVDAALVDSLRDSALDSLIQGGSGRRRFSKSSYDYTHRISKNTTWKKFIQNYSTRIKDVVGVVESKQNLNGKVAAAISALQHKTDCSAEEVEALLAPVVKAARGQSAAAATSSAIAALEKYAETMACDALLSSYGASTLLWVSLDHMLGSMASSEHLDALIAFAGRHKHFVRFNVLASTVISNTKDGENMSTMAMALKLISDFIAKERQDDLKEKVSQDGITVELAGQQTIPSHDFVASGIPHKIISNALKNQRLMEALVFYSQNPTTASHTGMRSVNAATEHYKPLNHFEKPNMDDELRSNAGIALRVTYIAYDFAKLEEELSKLPIAKAAKLVLELCIEDMSIEELICGAGDKAVEHMNRAKAFQVKSLSTMFEKAVEIWEEAATKPFPGYYIVKNRQEFAEAFFFVDLPEAKQACKKAWEDYQHKITLGEVDLTRDDILNTNLMLDDPWLDEMVSYASAAQLISVMGDFEECYRQSTNIQQAVDSAAKLMSATLDGEMPAEDAVDHNPDTPTEEKAVLARFRKLTEETMAKTGSGELDLDVVKEIVYRDACAAYLPFSNEPGLNLSIEQANQVKKYSIAAFEMEPLDNGEEEDEGADPNLDADDSGKKAGKTDDGGKVKEAQADKIAKDKAAEDRATSKRKRSPSTDVTKTSGKRQKTGDSNAASSVEKPASIEDQ